MHESLKINAGNASPREHDSSVRVGRKTVEPWRVLVVEDHRDTAVMICKLLQMLGYSAKAATTAAEALDLAASETFDLVLSDITLGDGSGHELMRRLQRDYSLKGIALSGRNGDDDVQRSREAGFAAYVVKPVDSKDLDDAISSVMTSSD